MMKTRDLTSELQTLNLQELRDLVSILNELGNGD